MYKCNVLDRVRRDGRLYCLKVRLGISRLGCRLSNTIDDDDDGDDDDADLCQMQSKAITCDMPA